MGATDGIYQDIDGAPFKIGDKVKVVCLADDTAEPKFLRREGTVLYFEYTCGCGQRFPHDPMIGVKFTRCIEEFWKEELRLISRLKERRAAGKLSRHKAFHLLCKLAGKDRARQITW